jgi:hypothetical protein
MCYVRDKKKKKKRNFALPRRHFRNGQKMINRPILGYGS